MMILGHTAARNFRTSAGPGKCSKIGHAQARFASVSAPFYQSRPEGPQWNNYLEKYQEKLERKARECRPRIFELTVNREGHGSISELREAYKPKVEDLRKKMDFAPQTVKPAPAKPSVEGRISPPAVTPIKTLSSYIDVEKLKKHTDPKEIELIWRAGHAKDSILCAVIPKSIYERMIRLAREHAMLVLPLPRPTGIEMHFMQFKFPVRNVTHVLFTSLLEYKTHGEFARPHTMVMHFEDLAEEKEVVLMRGEIDLSQNLIGLDEAMLLVMGVQKLYGADPESERGRLRRKLIEEFSSGSENFDVNILMDELNRID
jgi:ATP synthase mitochondrial F1 complex assembly factor 1